MANEILCISDLHIGNGEHRDNFTENELKDNLLGFIDYSVKEGFDLMVLGDLFDFWMCSVGEVLNNNLDIIDKLSEVKARYLVGNHDVDILPLMNTGWFEKDLFKGDGVEVLRSVNNTNFLFKHGHDGDAANKGSDPGKGRVWTIYAGMVKDMVQEEIETCKYCELEPQEVEKILLLIPEIMQGILHPFADRKRMARVTVTKSVWDFYDNMADVKKNIEAVAPYFDCIYKAFSKVISSTGIDNNTIINELLKIKENDNRTASIDTRYEKVVVGHTHYAGRRGNWYYNTGCWDAEGMNVLKIDSYAEVSFYNWNGRGLDRNQNAGEV